MSLNYTTYTTTIANLMEVAVTDANFQQILPSMIDDAEIRICQDVDFLGMLITDSSGVTTAANRNFTLPGGNAFFVLQAINVITPAGQTNPDFGTRNPLLPASKEVLDFLYPTAPPFGLPQYFARVNQESIILGPWPGSAYTLEITGTQHPTPLSASNPTTFISTFLPNLMIAASMIYAAAYQQNFSASGDNPAQATNWHGHYQEILKSSVIEQARMKFEAEGWSPQQPSPIVSPPRT